MKNKKISKGFIFVLFLVGFTSILGAFWECWYDPTPDCIMEVQSACWRECRKENGGCDTITFWGGQCLGGIGCIQDFYYTCKDGTSYEYRYCFSAHDCYPSK
jgi:hypothetical protein